MIQIEDADPRDGALHLAPLNFSHAPYTLYPIPYTIDSVKAGYSDELRPYNFSFKTSIRIGTTSNISPMIP